MKMYCREPQARYSDYLAEYLNSGFQVRQIGNTYNSVSNGLEQMMTLLILVIGAWIVMNPSTGSGQAPTAGQGFTPICMCDGMLVAFQMFASRVFRNRCCVCCRGFSPIQPRRTPCGCCAW